MNNLTLKQLRYVQALAAQGHFGRAAEVSAISQPALSMQIKELELSLGTALFERAARSVRLTPFGEQFLERAQVILRAVDELGELALAAQGGIAGRLRIGVIPTIAPYLLPRLLGRLSQLYEGLDIHVRETLTQKLIEELADGRLDAAIVALPISEHAFTEVALFEENLVLVRPDAQADHPVPSRDMLRDMRVLLLEEGHCFRDQALSFCALNTARTRNTLDGSSLSTLVQMVGAGLGVTLIPEMAVPVETRSAAVSIARLRGAQPKRQVGMIWRKSSPMADHLHQIADAVSAVAISP